MIILKQFKFLFFYKPAVCPPSTGINWPVINFEASEAKKTITGAKSLSGSPYS